MAKYITDLRHIEFQILADSHGNTVHLGGRDCSLQRRHQKLIEESLLDGTRWFSARSNGASSTESRRKHGYTTVGTVEFLLGTDRTFHVIETNTRIQAEPTVTAMVTGIYLIEDQIRCAAGEPLRFRQRDVSFRGHAIEVRINAEDPSRRFEPHPSCIQLYNPPGGPGIRVDSHAYAGYVIPPDYDSMIGKLIVHGEDRGEALARCVRALKEFIVEGVPTTIKFALHLLHHDGVKRGRYHTGYIEKLLGTEPFGGAS